ncbi:MAG TPA: glycosyltransferase family 2 protein [Methylomirabilota bacterium]|nr:glycosyltransferase family 2 protein [Methylomirabilota bacterium]
MASAAGLSIVIVTWNARDAVARCLDALAAAPPAEPHDITVVDNASTDGVPAMVRGRFPSVRLIETGTNLGFAAAANRGARVSSRDLVLLLNPDTIVPAGAVDALIGRLRERPDVAAIGPRIVDADGHPEWSWGDDLTPLAEARRRLLEAAVERDVPGARVRLARLTGSEREVDWLTGACLLVRRDDAERTGFFDEGYFLYCEDADFCRALRARGRRVLFSPVATVTHHRGRSAAAAGGRAREAWRASRLRYYARYAPRWLPLLRLWQRARGRPSAAVR